MPDDRPAGRSPERPEVADHRARNRKAQQEKLRRISDPIQRAKAEQTIQEYYESWDTALKRAHVQRYEDSPRIFERKIDERNIDPRLIYDPEKKKIRKDAILDAVARSRMRAEEVNRMMPQLIDKALDNAIAYERRKPPPMPDREPRREIEPER